MPVINMVARPSIQMQNFVSRRTFLVHLVRMKGLLNGPVMLMVPLVLLSIFIMVKLYPNSTRKSTDSFSDYGTCGRCKAPRPCKCNDCPKCGGGPCSCGAGANGSMNAPSCPTCPLPDPAKWVLKATVPPCPPMPDMIKYMLKTECPPLPDMSKYVLKSSVPKCPPCISTCSKPCKIGECPPCPRPRCPIVKCPDPKACPACPAAMCAPCPEPNIRCKADYQPGPVRPMLASTNAFGM
jgi:hypothetical protein